jgi:peptide/nickel transport system permease protein
MKFSHSHATYWQSVWLQFRKHRLGLVAFWIICLFILVGIYAPLLASSKPLMVYFQGQWFFPLFRYLFYPGFFTKKLDIFYNLLMFIFPLFLLANYFIKNNPVFKKRVLFGLVVLQLMSFLYLIINPPLDPARSLATSPKELSQQTFSSLDSLLLPSKLPNWSSTLDNSSPYAQLNLVLRYQQRKQHYSHLKIYEKTYLKKAQDRGIPAPLFPLLWVLDEVQEKSNQQRQQQTIEKLQPVYASAKKVSGLLKEVCHSSPLGESISPWVSCDFLSQLSPQDQAYLLKAKQTVNAYEQAEAQLIYLNDRHQWLEKEEKNLKHIVMPLWRPFHWEEDAGGDQSLNQLINWWDLTRINRKDMVASLLFGVRVSLSVGILAIGLALCFGIPIGAFSGYYGGKIDLVAYRLIEIWESMPTFFMLLMIVAFLQTKSIFLVIAVIGFFGWTGFSRFIRGEFFRQKQLPYTEACRALGYSDRKIIFSHLLPNAIPPLLTLIPFAMMGAITSEAGLSFLGLGEEGSNSWGVLMDEGRTAFPSESYLLWPPAILLTILLVSIALMGDALRDALDPKLHQT